MKPALICLCFQALAEALKTNASVKNIDCDSRDGDEGRQGLVCGMGSAESLNAAACHDVTFPYFPASCDSDKFGWFGGAGVSSFMVDRGDFFEHLDGE